MAKQQTQAAGSPAVVQNYEIFKGRFVTVPEIEANETAKVYAMIMGLRQATKDSVAGLEKAIVEKGSSTSKSGTKEMVATFGAIPDDKAARQEYASKVIAAKMEARLAEILAGKAEIALTIRGKRSPEEAERFAIAESFGKAAYGKEWPTDSDEVEEVVEALLEDAEFRTAIDAEQTRRKAISFAPAKPLPILRKKA